jgi:hypothetical protein
MASPFNTYSATTTRPPLYTLSLRNPGNAATFFSGNTTYTFPIAPQFMRKEKMSLAQIMDIAGPSANQGVARNIDLFGEAPPIYTIRGTTGAKHHSTDGYIWDGIQSIQIVQNIIDQFWVKNAAQIEAGQGGNLFMLEFYDYYMNEYWQVVPIGPQGIEQNADKPLWAYYTFRFAAVKPVSAAIPAIAVDLVFDTLGANGLAGLALASGASGIFSAAVSQVQGAVSNVQSFASNVLKNYSV